MTAIKLCISSTGTDLDSIIDPRFGRCAYFILVDPLTMEFEALPNDGAAVSSGAGIRAAQLVSSRKATAVITGHVGPNAFSALQAADIDILASPAGIVKDAIEAFNSDRLSKIGSAGVVHAGMQGMGYGAGFRGGRVHRENGSSRIGGRGGRHHGRRFFQ